MVLHVPRGHPRAAPVVPLRGGGHSRLGLSRAPLVRGRAFARNAEWFRGFVRALDLKDLTLVVHATAGPSALDMAVHERERIRALVVSNSFAWPLEGDRRLEAVVRVVSSRVFAARTSTSTCSRA